MDKVWKIVSTIAIIALVLGVFCILAGFVTGGDIQNIKDILYATYNIEDKIETARTAIGIMPLG